ncbi:MAG: GNAT family N-acetyltransferase [Planctomycetota bacterium]
MPQLRPADLDDPRVVSLLNEHASRAVVQTKRGCAHALDASALSAAEIDIWAAWESERPIGVGALKRLSATHGELKSMYTAPHARRSGVGSLMLRHLIMQARNAGMTRLSLETGSWPYFDAARAMYRRHGFVECPAFGGYPEGDQSVFMTLELADQP